MNQNKKSNINNQLVCEVCKVDFVSDADYALHQFSKKHCDNLLRIARHKPIITKVKNKNEKTEVEKEPPTKVKAVPLTGSFAKYGYFVPGEIYTTAEVSKEFNTEYDPYLQKFAENPYKEKITPPNVTSIENKGILPLQNSNITSFSRKKRKKIKTCQICNVALTTVPEYEAHMKSPQHIWKLKISGMGVSAHFVKASTDLHTTDIGDDSKPAEHIQETSFQETALASENTSNVPFPSLYCDVCELLLNSPQQYNAHVSGKAHVECAQRKAEMKAKKEKVHNPAPNQLYCYSCKISLNNLFQYNEHRNGKKHKIKCKQLIREGITIPPEERVQGLTNPQMNPNKPIVYPEFYEKFVLERQKQCEIESNNYCEPSISNSTVESESLSRDWVKSIGSNISVNSLSGMYHCDICNLKFGTLAKYEFHVKSREHIQRISDSSRINHIFKREEVQSDTLEIQKTDITPTLRMEYTIPIKSADPNIIFHTKNNITILDDKNTAEMPNHLGTTITCDDVQLLNNASVPLKEETTSAESGEKIELKSENLNNNQVVIISENESLKCNICTLNFSTQTQFDIHLSTENHLKKILELKLKGTSDCEILSIIFTDRRVIKPDKIKRFSCSICNVNTDNRVECEQHLSSIVHKYTLKDYKRKRTIEVKNIVESNKKGIYFCNICKEGWNSLVEYTQHLHFVKHRSTQRAEKAKKVLARRKTLFLQKQRFKQSLKRKSFLAWRLNSEKNPGVRTKICGVAINLYTGAQAPIPNLEPLEPKIDPTKNVQLGVVDQPISTGIINDVKKSKMLKVKQRQRKLKTSRQLLNPVVNQQNSSHNNICSKNIPPLIPPSNSMRPPLLPPHASLQPHSQYSRPRLTSILPNGHWSPYPSFYQYSSNYYGRPPVLGNPYLGSVWPQRARRSRYSPCYR